MLDGMELFGMGWSWGGYESLIVPAHPTRTVTKFEHKGPLIRIHAGLEAAEDLIDDLDNSPEEKVSFVPMPGECSARWFIVFIALA